MNSSGESQTEPELSESQRAALVTLLADEDQPVYQTVREKLLACGPQAAEWLRPHAKSRDPVLRRRVHEIVKHFDRQAADNRFLGFCLNQGERFDLEEGIWLLARTSYPEISVEAYRAILDGYAAVLGERIVPGGEARQAVETINQYLFDDLGFVGNEERYYDPENSYLNRVIDRRTGNPISLCLIYILLAQRLQLPVTGIGLPGHFVCRYQSTSAEIYFDPFNRGRLLRKADCIQYLARGNFSLHEVHLTPVSPRQILLRICNNLHQVYTQIEAAPEATRIQRYLVALGR
jgi:regulator of sirC expression with transglutaminase-like and TPR domain